MEVHIARDGQRLGPYSPDDVRRQIAAGTLLLTDLAWTEGAPGWAPVSSFPEFKFPGAPIVSGPPRVPAPSPGPVVIYHSSRTSGAAVVSLVCGILSITALPLVASIPAIICGHIARRDIRNSGGMVNGDGMAVAGLVMGYLFLAVFVAFVLLVLGMAAVGIGFGFLSQGK